MDRELFEKTLRYFKHRQPFQPFTVAMNNGDRLEVDYPDGLAVNHGAAAYIGPGSVPSFFSHGEVTRVFGDLAGTRVESV